MPSKEKSAAIKAALEFQPKFAHDAHGPTSWAYVFSNGTNERSYSRACFGGIMSQHGLPGCEVFMTTHKGRGKRAKLPSNAQPYLQWLANDSVWSPIFLNKDPENIFKQGSLFDTDSDYHMLLQAAIFVRYCYEYPQLVAGWNYFSGFLTPEMAMWAAHRYSWNEKAKSLAEGGLNDTAGHTSLAASSFFHKELVSFLNKKREFGIKQTAFKTGACHRTMSITGANWFDVKVPQAQRGVYGGGCTDLKQSFDELGKGLCDTGFTDTLGRKIKPRNGQVIAQENVHRFFERFAEENKLDIFK